MTHWYSKSLGDGMMAYEPIADIEALFAPGFGEAGKPDDMAVFSQHVLEGSLHCQVMAYFSPAATDVARACGAAPCNKPDPSTLALVAGAPGCWRVLFD